MPDDEVTLNKSNPLKSISAALDKAEGSAVVALLQPKMAAMREAKKTLRKNAAEIVAILDENGYDSNEAHQFF